MAKRIKIDKLEVDRGLHQDMMDYVKTKDIKLLSKNNKLVWTNMTLLKIRSPVFRAMFNEAWLKAGIKKVDVSEYDSTTIEAFLDYLNTGAVENAAPIASDLLKLADYYDVKDLKKKAEDLILETVTKDNGKEVFDLLNQYSRDRLVELFIKQNVKPVPTRTERMGFTSADLNQFISQAAMYGSNRV